MHHYEIEGLENQWFSSHLQNRRQCGKFNGVTSDTAEVDIRVLQGSCFGPLLFLLYLNDLTFALRKAHATLYACDTAISYSSDKIEEIDVNVNAELACLEKWLQGNKVALNILEIQAVMIGSARKLGKIN